MDELTPTQESNVRLSMTLVRLNNVHKAERALIWREAIIWMRAHGADQAICDLAVTSNPYLSEHYDG